MTLLRNWLAVCARAWQRLDRPGAPAVFAWMIPLFFGLLSVRYGQDANWDLLNYHRYNPYALLNGKIGFDLAPGQWQSYFNPALDLLPYGLLHALPPRLAGFVMGALHGLNFVLLLGIARRLLAGMAAARYRLPVLLALAGCFGPGFLSEVGNSMGDNLTALFVLGALLLLLKRWQQLLEYRRRALALALAAGLLMGAGAGLKLTNAPYALAMCLALLALPGALWQRLRLAFVFGIGVLAGIAASAGFWYWKMWQVFGNPLFPQFNDRFHAPLAAPIGIGDTHWLPKGLVEQLLWPFIFTIHPERVIEIAIRPLIWPVLYLLIGALALRKLRTFAVGAGPAAPANPQLRFFLLFFALSYLVWLNLFGIYRYLVPLELLAPLTLWLAAAELMPAKVARRVAGCAIVLAAVLSFPLSGWGHAGWDARAYRAAVPSIAEPSRSMVFMVQGDPPMGWLVPFFPSTLAFVSLGSGFPESAQYLDRVAAMADNRSGPLYVMLQYLGSSAANQAAIERTADVLARYGMSVTPGSCIPFDAWIGRNRWPNQLCTVNRPARGR